MKLTTEMRQELVEALSDKTALKVIDEFCAEEVDKISSIIERWLLQYRLSLSSAESFIAGFEDDEMQQPFVNDWLSTCRSLLGWGPAPVKHKLRVVYQVAGDHTHMQIRAGQHIVDIGLALAGCITLSNEEFAAWRNGQNSIEFVDENAKS